MIDAGDVKLCAQTFGRASDPAVLLVAGTSCSMDWWTPEFCTQLADRGFFVIRFDQRDTGRAHHDPAGQPAYTLPDLAVDATKVLDAYGITHAHWAGFSQGGWLSQLAALDHRSYVDSLVLISSRATGHGPADPDLPEVSEQLLAEWASAPEGHSLDELVAGERALTQEPFEEDAVRDVYRSFLARDIDVPAALVNHPMADQGPRWRERLGEITARTLVLHGEQDPLFPPGNAERLAAEIPGARLRIVPGAGHEIPRRAYGTYVGAIASFLT
ncbi:hypothetical protein AOZ06_18975 [Kibdelosporangium phytohabitans]|uniref:AB hydrolase-1 domain-containing protein n=2 Tax=Kibdelosporangium phytohabitans TaxID=860235 RepID=A0A0N9I391_9PSEU|nr:hypothetical protein AOZ06_18975 [Kibdelosporangium phytohabitans]